MNWLGYRRVMYLPSVRGLPLADFYKWEYAPSLAKRDYTERDFPFAMFWGK
jgi:hypothetical protein